MTIEIVLPQLDPTVFEVVVEQYYATMGDTVRRGQPLAMVRGHRFVWDIPATTDGTLSQIVIEPGASATVGTPLVRLAGAEHPSTLQPQHKQRVTPLARRIAAAHGVDLASLTGTGCGGRITKTDVLRVVEPTIDDRRWTMDHPAGTTNDQSRTTDRRPTMVDGPQSMVDAPYVLTALEVDLSRAVHSMAAHQARTLRPDVEITLIACIVHTVVEMLQTHHYVNSVWSEAGLIVRGRIHIGVTVVEHEQLCSTLIENAADLSLVGIARRLGDPHPDQPSNAATHRPAPTFSISTTATNWLSYLPPFTGHSAHLHIGAPRQRVHITTSEAGDAITMRPILLLTLIYDARALTQTQADAFLCAVKQRLEHLSCM